MDLGKQFQASASVGPGFLRRDCGDRLGKNGWRGPNFFTLRFFLSSLSPSPRSGLTKESGGVPGQLGEQRVERGLSEPGRGAAASAAGSREGSGPDLGATLGLAMAC